MQTDKYISHRGCCYRAIFSIFLIFRFEQTFQKPPFFLLGVNLLCSPSAKLNGCLTLLFVQHCVCIPCLIRSTVVLKLTVEFHRSEEQGTAAAAAAVDGITLCNRSSNSGSSSSSSNITFKPVLGSLV